MGTLYVVATPIGNLEDITQRALRVLREVALIAAEDTRKTRILLQHYGISTPLTSYYEHNKLTKLDFIVGRLGHEGVALVAEAGTPAISDPGYELVKAAIAAGHRVVPVPGPSAIIAALSAAGLPTDQFVYAGFLPRQPAGRRRRLVELADEPRTVVLYEAPHRLLASLRDMQEILGDRQMAAARELTKIHEEIVRGTVGDVLAHFTIQPPRGEFTLVIAGRSGRPQAALSEADLQQRLSQLLAEGLTPRRAAAVLARETGMPAREIYSRHAARRGSK